MKNCPKCRLINPTEAMQCDCGYGFESGEMESPRMKKIENTDDQTFDTTEEMIRHLINNQEYTAVCPGDIAVDEKSPWFWVLIGGVISIALVVLGEILNNINIEAIASLIIWPFIIYAFIKGFRSRPDVLVIAKDIYWLITGVTFNKKQNKFSYLTMYQIYKTEIRKKFCLFSTIRFKVPKLLTVQLVQSRRKLKKAKKYYTDKVISAKQTKKILFKT